MSSATAPHSTDVLRDRVQKIDALFAPHNRSDMPGCVAGISIAGRVIYRKAFGLASVQHGVANTPQTRMRIGSTSKHFTCLAALLLAEEGKLDIDAPVSTALPTLELPELEGMPTLRQFMSHTSGWRCTLDVGTIANGMALVPKGWMPRAVARQQGVNFAPGWGQMYCNSGYHLLSLAIDGAAGMTMEEFLRDRVFLPLEMRDTSGVPSDITIVPGMAALHVPDPAGGWRRGMFATEEIRGEGNLVSTVDDMLRWLAHLRGAKRVGSEAIWQQMLTPAVLANGLRSVYGLGLYRHGYRGLEVIHHAGAVMGGNSQMLTVPSHELDIVLMANGLPLSMQDIARKIVDILLEDHLGPEEKKAPLERFRHLVGTKYHGRSGMTIGFGELPDQLGLCFMDNPPMPLLRDEGEQLRTGFEDAALGPLVLNTAGLAANAEGQPPEFFELSDAGNLERLVRLPAVPPSTPTAGAALVGHWFSNDLGASAEIAFEGEDLILSLRGEYSGARRYKVTAYSDIAFGVADAETGAIRLMLTREDDGSGFRLDGIRARKLAFSRNTSSDGISP